MSKTAITDLILRDAHQSLLATRMTTADMLPCTGQLDRVGFWSLETWGGATFDSCIRFLNEDPWERIRRLKEAMPNTPMQMLLRGQNILGYRNYADDVVDKFVERAIANGVDVFRIFDALNDPRNLATAMKSVKKRGKHAQPSICYTISPVHTIDAYVSLAKELKQMDADSICIKDMAGLLKPFEAYELVGALKKATGLPIHLHSHATTGMSVATQLKGVEAGADMLDTTISSMSMGTSHSPTETLVEILQGTEYDTELDVKLLVEIAAYFREVRKKYRQFESLFVGADTRILLAQVPGGMLSNLEGQLKEQKAADKMDQVLDEIAVVQKDFGYPPLVTPTSQIVGTQAVFNVLFGSYKRLTKESLDLLAGRYGHTPAAPNSELVAQAVKTLGMEKAIDHRPADDIPNELDKLEAELKEKQGVKSVNIDDVLTYALFPQPAMNFFKNRHKGPVTFDAPADEPETTPSAKTDAGAAKPDSGAASGPSDYVVNIDGKDYAVTVRRGNASGGGGGGGGAATASAPAAAAPAPASAPAATGNGGNPVEAPVAGSIFKLLHKDGDQVAKDEPIVILEAMKMEFTVNSPSDGAVHYSAKVGDAVDNGEIIATVS